MSIYIESWTIDTMKVTCTKDCINCEMRGKLNCEKTSNGVVIMLEEK